MRRIAAISALLFVVGFMAYRVTAQPGPLDEGTRPPVDDPFTIREPAPRLEGKLTVPVAAQPPTAVEENPFADAVPLDSPPIVEFVDAETRVSRMVTEFGSVVQSAVNDKVITEEQANRLLKELEVSLAIKRAHLDLLRITASLDKLGKEAQGVPGAEQVMELRQRLLQLQEPRGGNAPHELRSGQPTVAPNQR